MTIEIADLNLTDAVEAAAVKFAGEKKWQHMDMLTRQNVKQQLLEMLLPTLPYLIKQIGHKAYVQSRRDAEIILWNESADHAAFELLGYGDESPYTDLDVDLPSL